MPEVLAPAWGTAIVGLVGRPVATAEACEPRVLPPAGGAPGARLTARWAAGTGGGDRWLFCASLATRPVPAPAITSVAAAAAARPKPAAGPDGSIDCAVAWSD